MTWKVCLRLRASLFLQSPFRGANERRTTTALVASWLSQLLLVSECSRPAPLGLKELSKKGWDEFGGGRADDTATSSEPA